jgi:hypothetical protein
VPRLINTFFVMATFPSMTSARASYQRVVGRPVASISCTRQVKWTPSGELQCGSIRDASQNSPATTPSSTIAHQSVSIAHQHAPRRAVLAVTAVALVAVLAACSGGGRASTDNGSTTAAPKSSSEAGTTATTVRPTTTTLATGAADLGTPTVTGAEATSVDGTAALDPTLQTQIADAVHTYVNAATGTPLGTGKPAVLDGVLTAAAATRLTPPTRDALTDEGLPALAAVKTDRANVTIDAFTGPDQSMVVNAAIDVAVSASTPGGSPVKIVRNGTLMFVNDGGTWKIDAFNLAVERDIP